MSTASLKDGLESNQTRAHPIIIFATVWHALLALAVIILSITIFRMESLSILGKPAELGRPVQVFAGLIVLIPAVLGIWSSVLMFQRQNQGRFLALIVNFTGFVLMLFGLFGIWGLYGSYEHIVDTLMANARLTIGFAVAYALFRIAGRLSEDSRVRDGLERVSFVIAGLTLIGLLIFSNVLQGANYLLSTYSSVQTWIFTAVVVIFGFLTWRLIMMGSYFNETPHERTAWQGWFMLSPNIIGFLVFFAGPLLLSLYLSFTDSSVGQVPKIVGFGNYAELLSLQIKTPADDAVLGQNTLDFGYALVNEVNLFGQRYVIGAKDRLFWVSLGNTLLFCLMLLPLAIIPALLMSLILNSKLPGMHFFRALYFLPSVAAVVGTALIWRWLYTPTTGFISYSLTQITGLFGLPDPEIAWLSDPRVVLFSIVLLAAWQVVGYNTVLFLAGLQGIPISLYEAAEIDGANPVQRFWNVTLPMLAPTTFFVVITTMVTGLQVFNEPYALFPSRPIPEDATTLVYYLYTQGFNQFQFGYASSIAWVLFLIIFLFTFIQFRLNRNEAYG